MIPYMKYHFERLILSTNNLYTENDSICLKCHNTKEPLNCLFCYCPLYDDNNCNGEYIILENGVKDCSNCLKPHTNEFILQYLHKLYG